MPSPQTNDPSKAAILAAIEVLCRELKMPAIARELEAVARQARDGNWPYEEAVHRLLDHEVKSRRQSAAASRLKAAGFPDLKTLDQLDYKALSGISKQKVMELGSCDYIGRGDDVVIAGPIGTGKSHLAVGLGVEATRRRYHVRFCRAADLVRELLEARDERVLGRLHRRYQSVHLLIIDELGFVPFNRAGGELLFNLLADRYERRSTAITTNLAFAEWVQVFHDEKLTAALLDRLGHHAHILTTKGESYRMRSRVRRGKKEEAQD